VAIAGSKGRTNQRARTQRAIVAACVELIRQRRPVTMPEVSGDSSAAMGGTPGSRDPGAALADLGLAIPTLETVLTELASIRRRLTDLDNGLRPLLADHAEAHEEARRVRPLFSPSIDLAAALTDLGACGEDGHQWSVLRTGPW
jgi:hypothetical protein